MKKRIALVAVLAAAITGALAGLARGAITPSSPIQHVVVIYQENHTFDNVLGKLCVVDSRCDGASSGTLSDGTTIPLSQATNLIPNVAHNSKSQKRAIDGGKMDRFDTLKGCKAPDYLCYSQFDPSQIPNLAALARQFAISDRTFSLSAIPSFGAHIELVNPSLDGFMGDNPNGKTSSAGWGCDSGFDAPWQGPDLSSPTLVPSCIPDYGLDPATYPYGGAYRATPVNPQATIMERLEGAGLSWKLYAGTLSAPKRGGYQWAICPTYASCLYTSRAQNMVNASNVITDAQNGTLPNFSVVIPTSNNSQHNNHLMDQGDNWIGSVMSAIEASPDWTTTAVFITYDDCGCFYDHVPPPTAGMGIRVPMVIASPYVKPAYTDSNTATFASMLAFTEHLFGLAPLGDADANAYDYSNAFDFGATPTLQQTKLKRQPLSRAEQRYSKAHANDADPDDT